MNRRPQLVAGLRIHEGLRLVPYRDTEGFWSIGYGHNLDAKPLRWYKFPEPITKRIAEAILDTDVDDAIASLDRFLPWWRELDDVREQVLADMAFNMGVDANPENGLDSFKNTLLAVREGRWRDARNGMLSSKWAGQVGKSPGQRAYLLAEMMLTGVAAA